MSLGLRLKQLRGHESRKSLADKLGIDQATIVNYENDKRLPNSDFIAKLCQLYNISADWLIYGRTPKDNPPHSLIKTSENLMPTPQLNEEKRLEKMDRFKDELLNIYRENTNLREQIMLSKNRYKTYQEQLVNIREKIDSLMGHYYDGRSIEEIRVTSSIKGDVEGGDNIQRLSEIFNTLMAMADDLYVGRGSSRVLG